MISRFTASLMPWLLPCSPPVKNNNHNNNPPQLTTLKITSVTLLLLFRPSAIKRPPTSVKSLPLCITRRHTRHQPPSIKSHSHPHFKHAYTMSRPPSPSHAPAYQVDLLQALEPAQACAQRLNVVILQLLQRVA